jgi:hypothetical protein
MTDLFENQENVRARRELRVVPGLAIATLFFLTAGVLLDTLGFVSAYLPQSFVRHLGWLVSAHSLVRLGTMLAFLAWLHARYSSIPLVDSAGTSYAPWVAVAWFFVPIVNLYKPYLIVQELWEATESDSARRSSDSKVVLAWWTALIAAPITAIAIGSSRFAGGGSGPPVIQIVNVLNVVAGLLAIAVVNLIEERWNAKFVIRHGIVPGEERDSVSRDSSIDTTGQAAGPVGEDALANDVTHPAVESAPIETVPAQPAPPIPVVAESRELTIDQVREEVANRLRWARGPAMALAFVSASISVTFLLAAGLALEKSAGGAELVRHIAIILALLYTGLSLMALIPCAYLLRFARVAASFVRTRAASDFESALRLQARLWGYFVWVMAIVVFLELAAIAAVLATPVVLNLL